MSPRHFLWMAKWARNPPSIQRIKLVFCIIAICGVIFGLEYFGFLPDWVAAEHPRRIGF